jgi:hypothetical protein
MEMMATLKREMNGDVLMVSPFQGSGLLVTDNLGLRFAACPEPAEWAAQAITLRAFSPPDPGAPISPRQLNLRRRRVGHVELQRTRVKCKLAVPFEGLLTEKLTCGFSRRSPRIRDE